jgi:hypothetical protein
MSYKLKSHSITTVPSAVILQVVMFYTLLFVKYIRNLTSKYCILFRGINCFVDLNMKFVFYRPFYLHFLTSEKQPDVRYKAIIFTVQSIY